MENILSPLILTGSLWQIITNTSTFGMIILIILVIMSLLSLSIIIFKWRQFKSVESDNRRFGQQFKRSKDIAESLGQAKSTATSPISKIFLSGYNELLELKEIKNQGGAMQQSVNKFSEEDYELLEMAMERSLSEEITVIEKKVIFLASTANSAPFIGLLGTVVGIMDAFWAIGERGSASLAVVAPGIAEALLATIVGLVAAIPAVIAYNWATNKIKNLSEFSNNFILEFVAKVKKEQNR
ncbi:MAG: Tol-Pal system subunit TolQ [Calditrichaeota bacterium]|nr:MAG: Tol-Pal system subunit TolQ [Calditrichota bacterium]